MAGHSSGPLGAESSPQLPANKKIGTSNLHHNELDSDNTLKELGGGPQASRETAAWVILISVWEALNREPNHIMPDSKPLQTVRETFVLFSAAKLVVICYTAIANEYIC